GASGRLKSKITGGPSSLAAEVESADPVEVPGLGAMVVPASPVVDGGGPVVVARFGSVEVEPGSSSPEVSEAGACAVQARAGTRSASAKRGDRGEWIMAKRPWQAANPNDEYLRRLPYRKFWTAVGPTATVTAVECLVSCARCVPRPRGCDGSLEPASDARGRGLPSGRLGRDGGVHG